MKQHSDARAMRKDYLQRTSIGYRMMVFFKIRLIWFEPRPIKGYLRCERLNKWNPLTWFIVAGMLPYAAVYGIWTFLTELRDEFKTSRWG